MKIYIITSERLVRYVQENLDFLGTSENRFENVFLLARAGISLGNGGKVWEFYPNTKEEIAAHLLALTNLGIVFEAYDTDNKILNLEPQGL